MSQLQRHKNGRHANPAETCAVKGCNEPRLRMGDKHGRSWRSTLCRTHDLEHRRDLKALRECDPPRTRAGHGKAYTPVEVDTLWHRGSDPGQLWYAGRRLYGLVQQNGRYAAVLERTDTLIPLPDGAALHAGKA